MFETFYLINVQQLSTIAVGMQCARVSGSSSRARRGCEVIVLFPNTVALSRKSQEERKNVFCYPPRTAKKGKEKLHALYLFLSEAEHHSSDERTVMGSQSSAL